MAPAAISALQSLLVTATSAADTTKSASATVTLNPAPSSPAVYRVYAATSAYTDAQGRLWSPDAAYATGGSLSTSTVAIANTSSAPLYQSFRYNWTDFAYHFPVANGTYSVRLLFAETQYASQGQRVFSVKLNGQNALTNFDVIAAAGGSNTAVDRIFPVTVTNDSIDLQLVQSVSNPMLSAIEITVPAAAVAPAQVALSAGQTMQFSGPAGAVWSIQPALGSISAAGLYTAPASVASFEQVTVTAAANGQTASATVALAPAAGVFVPIRVNAGGGDLVDALGQLWSGDNGYTGGYFSATTNAIANTTFPALYQSQRWFYSSFQYQFAVPNGSRLVRLKFAETVLSSPGQRWFNVAVNGVPALTNFDIAAQAGGANRAVDVDIPVSVASGQVTILITPVQGNAVINGIEILDASSASSTVSVAVSPATVSLSQGGTQQFSATVTGATDTSVTWSLAPAVGSVSASGLYTAPASLTAAQNVTVTATSNANPATSASATVSLTPPVVTNPVAISVSPSSASLAQGSTQQFSAAVTNTTNTAVNWSISPAVGSISSSGLYSAPATVTSTQSLTVTATSAADSTQSASATITLNPPAPTSSVVYRVYYGAQPYTDPQGRTWNPDAAYATSSATAVSAAALPTVYQGYRYNWTDFGYHFAVANGTYAVKLQFAETQYTSQGLRVFSVKLNGQSALTNFDVYAAGGNAAVDRIFPVTVTNGAIDLTLAQQVGNPMLSAIEITAPALSVAPAWVALSAGQSLQFSGPSGAAWSIYPALGSISTTGLYTAPASIASFEQVTVTATSGGPSASATRRVPRASCGSGSRRAGSIPSFAAAPPRRSPSWASTATRSAGSRSARTGARPSRPLTGSHSSCRRRSPATSWGSATRRAFSR
jgi:hypothetical protein